MTIAPDLRTTAEWEASLGSQVRRARLAMDIDQASLAREANVSLGALKNLEAGKGSSLKTLVRVARALGKHEWLASFEPEPELGPLDLLRLQEARREPKRASSRERLGGGVGP